MQKELSQEQVLLQTQLRARLLAERRFLQVVVGPRQVGKTTMLQRLCDEAPAPIRYVSADDAALPGREWLEAQWETSRLGLPKASRQVLIIDEVQRIPDWPLVVKAEWDRDTRDDRQLHVVLTGSSRLLLQSGLSESLMGRFELHRLCQWGFPSMAKVFGFSVDDYLYAGGYPGAAPLLGDNKRWRAYMLDSLVDASIGRDILQLEPIRKPALLRALFELGTAHSAQVLSLNKILGQMTDAGNTTTLTHYLELLQSAGLLAGLQKHSGSRVAVRGSIPKFLSLDNGLLSAVHGRSQEEALADPVWKGRLVETLVGNVLWRGLPEATLQYWSGRNCEVDFVLSHGEHRLAIEVKSHGKPASVRGLTAFEHAFGPCRKLIVGGDGMGLEPFLHLDLGSLFG